MPSTVHMQSLDLHVQFSLRTILYRWRLPANWAAAWQDMPDSSLTSSTDEQTGRWNTCRSHPRTFLRQNTMGYLLDAGSLSLQIAEKKNSGPFWSSESFPTTGSDWPFLPLSGGAWGRCRKTRTAWSWIRYDPLSVSRFGKQQFHKSRKRLAAVACISVASIARLDTFSPFSMI